MRITVIGLPGSGKSTLARAISKKLGIPHIHLDRFWFEAGGRKGPETTPNLAEVRAHVDARAREAIAAPAWVSDGFYNRLQSEIAERADTIMYLAISPPLPNMESSYAHFYATRATPRSIILG